MRQLLILVLFIFCLAALNCTEYSGGLQRSSTRSEETSAVGTLRTIYQAQTTYNVSNANYGTFAELAAGGFLDSRFDKSNPEMHGYVYTMDVTPAAGGNAGSFTCNADPAATSQLGGRHFYIDGTSQEIHVNATRPATAADEAYRP